jgi:hypothetical protein
MADPQYRTDISALADELRRTYGASALDYAAQNAKQYLRSAAWKHCAMWLQVVNRLTAAEGSAAYGSR